MEGYRDGLAFAITAIREKELKVASPQGSLVASTKEEYSELAIAIANNPAAAATASEKQLQDVLAAIRLNRERIKRLDPSWLPTPQECDEYNPEEEKLKARRARLLERIQELVDQHPTYPEQSLAGLILADLRDELAAVESALGYPEPQEPEEA